MISAYREDKWLEANIEKEEGKYIQFEFENECGKIVYGFIKKEAGSVDGEKYYDIASYRGAEGPYIENVKDGNVQELIKAFQKAFEKYCRSNNIVAEFAKLDPWDTYAKELRSTLGAEYYGNYYCNDLTTDFYNDVYNRNAKRGIKKAVAGGVCAKFDFSGKTIPEFVRLYKNTEDKFNTSNYYRFDEKDIKKFFDIYGSDAFLINAVLEEKIITSVLVVMGKDVAHYLFLGSDAQFSKLQANCLLTYEAAMYCKSAGRKIFDMGGGIPGGGIEKFKRNFIDENGVWEYYAIKKIHNWEVYDELVNKVDEIRNLKFFPLYRG